MDETWTAIDEAVQSSEADQVNDAIDRIEDLDHDARARLFEIGFDELTSIYLESDDGYVRQSVVRVVDRLTPGMVVAVSLGAPASDDADGEEIRRRLDAACGFLLEAIQDEDGRVRQSAKRALQSVFRTYRALEDTETIAAVATELGELATTYDDKRRGDLRDSKEDAEHLLGPPGGRMIESIQELARQTDEL